ncbi:MAG: carbonic anhydrase [Armatimonadota bacterium]|nr:carbonic anhydrase [Armatimonadota bacterium]
MSPTAKQAWEQLLEGNARFRSGKPAHASHTPEDLAALYEEQNPIAAVIACSDSRVDPAVVFDQPLGSIFVSRVPGNVVSDSVRWMVEMAVGTLNVPIVVAMAHTGCLAVRGSFDPVYEGQGAPLRYLIHRAVRSARSSDPDARWREGIELNLRQTTRTLETDCPAVVAAIRSRELAVIPAIYEMESGLVHMLEG